MVLAATSPPWFVRGQRLPHIGLRNSELSSYSRRRDTSLKCGANGIQLTTGQWDFSDVRLSALIGPRRSLRYQVRWTTESGVEFVPILQRNLRRRFASSNAALQSWSSSVSLNCVTAWLKFLGRTCRCVDVSAAASVAATGLVGAGEVSRSSSVENKSGAACSVTSRPIAIIMPR